jgi:hypothetical protein
MPENTGLLCDPPAWIMVKKGITGSLPAGLVKKKLPSAFCRHSYRKHLFFIKKDCKKGGI